MVVLALMMITTAGATVRGRKSLTPAADDAHDTDTADPQSPPLGKILLEGTVVGLVTGLVGAGGGFLVVRALALLGGLAMPGAVGTSLLVITMKPFAGLVGYLTAVAFDWPLVLSLTAAAVVGSLIGTRLMSIVPAKALRRGFGVFVLAMGVIVLVQELPSSWHLGVLGAAEVAAVEFGTTAPILHRAAAAS